jgi:hypothetical protein
MSEYFACGEAEFDVSYFGDEGVRGTIKKLKTKGWNQSGNKIMILNKFGIYKTIGRPRIKQSGGRNR